MKTRTLIILLIVLGLLAGAGALITRLEAPDRSKSSLGTPLLKDLSVNDIASISINDPEQSVSLTKHEDRWVVVERFNYPADFSRITDLVRKLKAVKIGRQFESSEEILKRLALKDADDPDAAKDEKGTRILLNDKKKTPLASILLGKTREAGTEGSFPAGQYVRLGRESKIYLIDQHFAYLQKKPADWLDKTLVELKEEEVNKISCLSADSKKPNYTLERREKGKGLEMSNVPAGGKVNSSVVNRLARALTSLRIDDISDPQAHSMERPKRLEYHLYNGMIYRVYPGKACSEDNRGCLQLEVDYEKPAPEKKEGAEEAASGKEGTSADKTPEEHALEAKQLNDRLSPWVYVIPKWQYDALITDAGQLLEKSDKKQVKK